MKPSLLLGIKQTSDLIKRDKKFKRYATDDNTITKLLPVNRFLIVEVNVESFRQILYNLKSSVYWNIYGQFFIKNTEVNSCMSAYLFLKTAWEFNILSAIFFCNDLKYGSSLYTFNPYSEKTTNFWVKIGSYKQENGHFLTMFRNANRFIGT